MKNTETTLYDSDSLNENETENKTKNRTQRGFSLIGIGAAVLLFGCLISLVFPHSHPAYNFLLYTPTSIGACMVMYGLYCVLE
ncbi:MAG: type II secretion system GspH family protein [Bacteroidia bacterium]|nr:type II secretion system GspH family protein [Bacteroidia bacterium]